MLTHSLLGNGCRSRLMSCAAVCAFVGIAVAPMSAAAAEAATRTPIKHVIIIIGENRTFDHIFATYTPVNKKDTVLNLLSQKIIKADGTPGTEYDKARQSSAKDGLIYELSPGHRAPYKALPPALSGGPSTPFGCQVLGITTGTSCVTSANIAQIKKFENGLDDGYYKYMLTGGTGQKSGVPDARILYDGKDASGLPPGPFQISNSETFPYDAYAASPVHRFYQMWQQLDCDANAANASNGWGCRADLFPWVEVTQGAGSNGAAQPAGFNNESTGEGSTAMGFYNVQQGDAPYLKKLADTYTMSDNYHQAVNGGTGANHVMLGTGDAIWFSDGNGNAQVPPNNPVNPANPGTPVPGYSSALSEIENPNPQPGTNNFYIQDGYGGGSGSPTATAPKANYGGGSYSNCSDIGQPGVAAVVSYLQSLPREVKPRCESGHYYLLNNYNPGYFGDGSNAYTDTNPNNYVYTIPPSSVRNIGDALNHKHISWAYYGDQWNAYLTDKYQLQFNTGQDEYCNICNWAQYSTSIMTNKTVREAHLKDTTALYDAIEDGTLPAVSYVKPSGWTDGHPNSSKLNLFEGFVEKIVEGVKANSKLWAETAIFITFDEGGGYYDSG
jgi:phospholipase C